MDHNQQKKQPGRPALPEGQRKERISVRLPIPMIDRLRAEDSPAKIIAAALQGYFTEKEDSNE